MFYYPDTILYRLRFVFVGALMVASFFVLTLLVSFMVTNSAQDQGPTLSSSVSASDASEDPNIISNGMFSAADGINKTMDSASLATTNGLQSIASATQSGTATVVRNIGKGVAAMLSVPGNILAYVSNSSVVGAVIRPSDHEQQVPIIDPNSPELLAALSTMPPTKDTSQTAPQNNLGPAWPIHGAITTEFGVPHWPYQPTHTGLDISDSKPAGVTPVRPFRPGRVIEAVHSNYGFGNHVIIDHGNGVTSLYGHLDSLSVQVGQEVDLGTTIGYEGTTGLSTGVHLHFEIRVNGQAANPHQFVSGQP